MTDNLVIQSLERLKEPSSDWAYRINEDGELGEVLRLLDKLTDLCHVEGSGNAAIATRNGGLELVCLICSKLSNGCSRGLVSALNTMASFLHGRAFCTLLITYRHMLMIFS